MNRLSFGVVVFLALGSALEQPPATQLAMTPPMGWNSWNWFAGKGTDKDIRQAADLIVFSGMHSKGLKLGIYSSPGAKACARLLQIAAKITF